MVRRIHLTIVNNLLQVTVLLRDKGFSPARLKFIWKILWNNFVNISVNDFIVLVEIAIAVL